MSYGAYPTEKTGTKQEEKDNGDVTVTVTKAKPLIWRIRHFFRGLRFDGPFRRRWMLQMWVYFAFFAQGTLGMLTLTLFRKNLTARPSSYLAVQRSRCADITHNEKEQAKAEASAGTDKVYEAKLTDVYDDSEDEMDAWMKKFSAKKKYDDRGHFKGYEDDEDTE